MIFFQQKCDESFHFDKKTQRYEISLKMMKNDINVLQSQNIVFDPIRMHHVISDRWTLPFK